MKRYYRTNPPGPNGPPTSTSISRPEGLTGFAALPVPRHIVRKIESLWLPGDQMVHLRLEWLRVVEGADHNVDLAWQPLVVLVQERASRNRHRRIGGRHGTTRRPSEFLAPSPSAPNRTRRRVRRVHRSTCGSRGSGRR